jgi:hypothetical protein
MKMYNMMPKERKDMNEEKACCPEGDFEWPTEMSVTSKKFPPIKDMKFGKEYMMTVCVKPIRMSIGKEDKTDMTLQIMEMGMSKMSKDDAHKEEELDEMVESMYPKKK